MIELLVTHKNGCGGAIYVTGGKLRRADLKKWRVTYRIGLYPKLDSFCGARKAIRYNVNKALEFWVKRSLQMAK